MNNKGVCAPDQGVFQSSGHTRKSPAQEEMVDGVVHPLLYQSTGSDVLVDFGGEDDPYHPMNWSFRKEALTTVLYGLTTS